MKITKELLKSWGACEEGFAWFISKNFDSDPDYSVVKDYADLERVTDDNGLVVRAFAIIDGSKGDPLLHVVMGEIKAVYESRFVLWLSA